MNSGSFRMNVIVLENAKFTLLVHLLFSFHFQHCWCQWPWWPQNRPDQWWQLQFHAKLPSHKQPHASPATKQYPINTTKFHIIPINPYCVFVPTIVPFCTPFLPFVPFSQCCCVAMLCWVTITMLLRFYCCLWRRSFSNILPEPCPELDIGFLVLSMHNGMCACGQGFGFWWLSLQSICSIHWINSYQLSLT